MLARTIIKLLEEVEERTHHNIPLQGDDIAGLAADNMRIAVTTKSGSAPRIKPLLAPADFNVYFKSWFYNRDRDIMPAALPPAMLGHNHPPPREALCYGLLFMHSWRIFANYASNFFWHHAAAIKASNPGLDVTSALVPHAVSFESVDPFTDQLTEGERDANGDLVWVAFGGISAKNLKGVIMSSAVSGELGDGGCDGIYKSELYVLLIQLASMAAQNDQREREQHHDELPMEDSLPQVLVINFTDKYARVVQGSLVRPSPRSDIIELRVSLSANMEYIGQLGEIIPGVWRQLLSWAFCATAGGGTGEAREAWDGERLVVPKVRGDGGGGDDEALRIASKSSAGSLGTWDSVRRSSSGSPPSPKSSTSTASLT